MFDFLMQNVEEGNKRFREMGMLEWMYLWEVIGFIRGLSYIIRFREYFIYLGYQKCVKERGKIDGQVIRRILFIQIE